MRGCGTNEMSPLSAPSLKPISCIQFPVLHYFVCANSELFVLKLRIRYRFWSYCLSRGARVGDNAPVARSQPLTRRFIVLCKKHFLCCLLPKSACVHTGMEITLLFSKAPSFASRTNGHPRALSDRCDPWFHKRTP